MTSQVRSYSEMLEFRTHEERFEYLSLRASVGQATFGFDRWINQHFYRSTEWRHVRNEVLARDMGLDMACEGFEIFDKPIIHHMNPMRPEQIEEGDPDILDPEYLVLVSHNTHNAIHYGDKSLLVQQFVERSPGDTLLWGQGR